ncbi:MAG TPA: serine/threonine-protein kinase, partial [Archangium sp.]|nr:serine/threonine-protein kinase [Archangium sp.]
MSKPEQQPDDVLTQPEQRALARGAVGGEQDTQGSGELGLPQVPEPGRTLVGRYTVLGTLGQGGMGVVLSAYDARLDRRVALKLLRPGREHREDRQERWEVRLVREAQSMARLSHPHVVAVYDAGGLEDGSLYIAMEYVEGRTLREWRLERERTWREVLEAYLEAGRGLAAAHAVGLVHRDFKPDNVLVGRDGRVKVTDFGVARAEATSSPTMPAIVPLPGGTGESWQESLTRPGRVVGTPRYMAPEVLRGRVADVRSDIFSYCVALYEALYKQPAFAGGGEGDRLRAQLEGDVSPPPARTQVPAWVGRVVVRGLSADPAQRPERLEELLATLGDDPQARWRARWRGAAVGLTGAVLASLAVGGWAWWQGPGCGGMERRLAGVWDEQVRARVKGALEGTGLAYAPDTARRVESLLDGYASQWVEHSREVCEVAGGTRSQGLRMVQEACLQRRRGQLGALTELLAREPDKELLPKAVQAATSLPPLSYCLEEKALLAAVPPPEDPAVRARVEALQPEVDRLKALLDAGKYKEGVARAEQVLAEVRAVDFAPLSARALHLMGVLQEAAADFKGAEAHLRESILEAAQGRELEVQAQAWASLVMIVGDRQGRAQEALQWELPLLAAAEQFGDAAVRARAVQILGSVLMALGRYEQALEHHERALALREKTLGPEHLAVASSLNSMGSVLRSLGRYEQALAHHERGLALREKLLGPEHPEVATALTNLGNVLRRMGRHEEALRRQERALAIWEKSLGAGHPRLAAVLMNLGSVLRDLGRYAQSLQN